MPVMMRETVLAANETVENVFSGSAFEFAQQNRLVSVGFTASATGLQATLLNGSDIIAEESSPPVLDRYPIIPDEMYFTDASVVGDRLVLRVRNTTAGPLTIRAIAQITNV